MAGWYSSHSLCVQLHLSFILSDGKAWNGAEEEATSVQVAPQTT